MKYNLLIACQFILCMSCTNRIPQNGEALIRNMYAENHSSWYSSLCFSQKVYNYKNDSIITNDVWHEVYQSPGKLAIKFTSWDSGNGMLFCKDSMYIFSNGEVVKKSERLHDLIVLGLEVNNQSPEKTISQAKQLGYNLNVISKTKLAGNAAWVVGDTSKLCFWVDAKSLLFLKMRKVTEGNFREVEFSTYEQIDGFPVATEILFYNNPGKLEMKEEYFDIRVNCSVNDSVFSPQTFINSQWLH